VNRTSFLSPPVKVATNATETASFLFQILMKAKFFVPPFPVEVQVLG
jgi:hypothetical protein